MVKAEKSRMMMVNNHAPMGFVGFVAFVGAFVYFAQGAKNFLDYLNAFVDAIVWPGILVYHILLTLHV